MLHVTKSSFGHRLRFVSWVKLSLFLLLAPIFSVNDFAQVGIGGGGGSWSITYEYSGSTSYEGALVVFGVKQGYGGSIAWSSGNTGYEAENQGDGTTNVWPCSVHSSGTITVVATWRGPGAVPNNLFLDISSSATSSASGSSPNGSCDDGLRHPDVIWQQTATLRSSTSQGHRRVYVANPHSTERFVVQMSADASSHDISGMTLASCGLSAVGTSRAVQVGCDLGTTYHREVGTDQSTGWTTGVAVANQRDSLGTMYGDREVGLYYGLDELGVPHWHYAYGHTYGRSLFGPWSTVYNDWYVTDPAWNPHDTGLVERETIYVSDSGIDSQATPFITGRQTQTVNYIATDDGDGFQADNWFVMNLHGKAQKEEEYKGPYSGYLHRPASEVSDVFPAVDLTGRWENLGDNPIPWVFTIGTSETYTYGAKLQGSADATVLEVVKIQFGGEVQLSTSSTYSVSSQYTVTIPAHQRASLWALPSGEVQFWNESLWSSQGYSGDDHVKDVTPGDISYIWFFETAGSDYGTPLL